MHIVDRPSFLAANGLPYEFTAFNASGPVEADVSSPSAINIGKIGPQKPFTDDYPANNAEGPLSAALNGGMSCEEHSDEAISALTRTGLLRLSLAMTTKPTLLAALRQRLGADLGQRRHRRDRLGVDRQPDDRRLA